MKRLKIKIMYYSISYDKTYLFYNILYKTII